MIGKLTGMPIPLNSLRQWILGLPGEATDYTLDESVPSEPGELHAERQNLESGVQRL
ncbi:outer membrane lipoprotein LolB [Enterobacter asburiae]|uniref:Outer-membrane lipoprotein LolB n=1 Tax=Enterobacter asburiae TaxID=61645 RepID=A0A376FCG8_ENTAS|nr:outer membrane lipoprotein LolB [Enterobacter asburiae]